MCFLCTECTDDAIGNIQFGSSEAALLNMNQIIEKHFWLQTDYAVGHVCSACWQQLSAFHSFYLNVEQAHNNLNEKQNELDTSLPLLEPELLLDMQMVKQEDDSVAASVKRRRGRPRKSADKAPIMDSKEFRAVLEQINLNEIKLEYPEADLSMADVLDEQEELSESDSVTDAPVSQPEPRPKPQQRTTRPKKYKKLRGAAKVKAAKLKAARLAAKAKREAEGSLHNMQKSKEFNSYIKDHFKIHCPTCSEELSDFSVLLVHHREKHNVRGYAVCCNRKFWKRGVLVDHLRRHQNPDLFKCHICQRVMGQRRSLELHMRMHEIKQRGRRYQCDKCPKLFYSIVVCERHKLTHIPKDQWHVPCTHCTKSYPNEYLMQQHVKLVHLRKFDKICDVCGKQIRGREALVRHMQEHEGSPQQLLKCHLCSSMLTTKYGLARHIKMMHTADNLQPMQCEVCLKISPSLQSHQHHIKYTHNTARTHQCPMCEKAFKRPTELREHMTTHTGEVLYTCLHCPKTFNSNANMHAHRKKMHFKEWQEYRFKHQRNRKVDTIIGVSLRKSTAAPDAETTTTSKSMSTTLVNNSLEC
ncbi:CG8388 [Drosophila busckii]|uniref:CG8388 n=1 Tax=Drosophila busckii TaxID=30019 RepID=A0A0M3QUV2_DROBS|nr:transcription factor grauzone [Drosophila busckii]ALC41309.1 CG8388 [Drosophila busckii]